MRLNSTLRRIGTSLLVGIAYSFSLIYLIGFAAALAWPSWFSQLAAQNMPLAMFLWELLTIVPVIVVTSALFGFILARLVSRQFLLAGLIALSVALFLPTILYPVEGGFLRTIRVTIFPNHVYEIGKYLVLYLALPIATFYFGRNRSAA